MKLNAILFVASSLVANVTLAQTAPSSPATPATTTTKTPAATSAAASTKSFAKAPASAVPEAAGGGAGKVWVNSKSNTYHCSGSKFYGKTKVGEYMTEAEAKTKGAHADHGKACS